METLTRVTSTDEDEIIDIEGDDSDVTVTSDNTIRPGELHCDVGIKKNSASVYSPIPFKRLKKDDKVSKNSSVPETEFTKWWKSASDFHTPVTPIKKRDCDVTTDHSDIIDGPKLNPILQSPKSMKSSFSESGSTIYDDNGEEFEPPREEICVSSTDVSEKEREKFPEFFSGATKYSPHNYIAIRNTILKLWKEKRPEHVNKVMLRPILRKVCGNVNNIGKIHRYLESIGAINFGSDAVWWKRKRRKTHIYRPPRTPLDTDFKLKRALEQRMSGRSRKRPTPFTSDHESSDSIGGYTIDHANNNALIIPRPKEKKDILTKSPTSKKYNLVKCREYPSTQDCPYEVTIHSSALIVMDVHSHLSVQEVMGLFGGHVVKDVCHEKVRVQIMCAQPCKSSGSTRHCEMDPVSQSYASEQITKQGLKVIGWYHSHPTFPPHPSETDIATQLDQQRLFSSHDSEFLGIILTPYYKHQIKTDVNLIHVERLQNNGSIVGVPHKVPYEIDSHPPLDGDSKSNLLPIFSNIVDTSVTQAVKGNSSSRLCHLLDPIVQGSTVTHLDKLMKSISSFVTSQHLSPTSSGTGLTDVNVSHDDTGLAAPYSDEEHILGSQDIMTSAYEIVTSESETEDIGKECYSIDQNFPSLADGGFCDDSLLESDVTSCGDVMESGAESPQTFIPISWSEVFDKLKILLLNASEKVLNK